MKKSSFMPYNREWRLLSPINTRKTVVPLCNNDVMEKYKEQIELRKDLRLSGIKPPLLFSTQYNKRHKCLKKNIATYAELLRQIQN